MTVLEKIEVLCGLKAVSHCTTLDTQTTVLVMGAIPPIISEQAQMIQSVEAMLSCGLAVYIVSPKKKNTFKFGANMRAFWQEGLSTTHKNGNTLPAGGVDLATGKHMHVLCCLPSTAVSEYE